ncbi:850_t:CDS:2 [Diversispora eburnea]|uniref:850_t:CDS:1 n=1 Tax=Diversispora eburnea TaxID=1213867 RepID=A0A9N8VLA4_9GLOM|nr:850_t:CDS:2 [Diversispora eburnea]
MTNYQEKSDYEIEDQGQISVRKRLSHAWSIRWFVKDFQRLVDQYPRGRFLTSNNFILENDLTRDTTGYDCRIRLFPNGNRQYLKPGYVSLYLQVSPRFKNDDDVNNNPQGIFQNNKILKMEILRFNQNSSYNTIKTVHLTLDNVEKNDQNSYGLSKFCRTDSILTSLQDPIEIAIKITILDSPINEMTPFEPFLYNDRFSDIEFKFECGGKLNAHRIILASRSKYFEKLFDENKSLITEEYQSKNNYEDKLTTTKIKRKLTGLLNKLLWDNMDKISKQIINFANQSKDENDGHTLRTIIYIIFDHACQCRNYSHLYVHLCKSLMDGIDQEIKDINIKMPDGSLAKGRQLFLKYLYTKCQLEFEKGCRADHYIKRDENGDPVNIKSNEFFLGLKEKRRWLGLARFFAELFKRNVVTESMMHRCIKHCLNKSHPFPDQIELLCEILRTAGKFIDHEKAKPHLDTYFERLLFFAKHPQLNRILHSMLMEIIELRENDWMTVEEMKLRQMQNQETKVIHINDVDYKTFKKILCYFYTGKIDTKLDREVLKGYM